MASSFQTNLYSAAVGEPVCGVDSDESHRGIEALDRIGGRQRSDPSDGMAVRIHSGSRECRHPWRSNRRKHSEGKHAVLGTDAGHADASNRSSRSGTDTPARPRSAASVLSKSLAVATCPASGAAASRCVCREDLHSKRRPQC